MPGGPVVEFSGVTKTYQAGGTSVRALGGINLAIEAERFTVLVGPSGSGKSTLLNLMGCIDRPDEGTVKITGLDIGRLADKALSDFRASQIGFIFQAYSLLPVLSAYENVEYPLLLVGTGAAERRRATLAMLEAVGLSGEAHRRPNELSGGQKQRVAIARALIKHPAIVLADEPTANLDSQTGAGIIALMRRMQAEHKTTFIFSTHDPHLIAHADKTFRLRDGLLIDNGESVQ